MNPQQDRFGYVVMDVNSDLRKFSFESTTSAGSTVPFGAPQVKKPLSFEVKKWILSAFILINILALIHYSVFVVQITDKALHKIVDMKPQEYAFTSVSGVEILRFLVPQVPAPSFIEKTSNFLLFSRK